MNNNDVVIIELDRPRALKYSYKALKTLVAMTNNKSEDDEFEALEKTLYFGLLRDAKEHGETLRLEDMEDIMDHAESIAYINEKVEEAMNVANGGNTIKNNQAVASKKAKNKAK